MPKTEHAAKPLRTKPVWVAWTNTDLTEGRGLQVPKAVCETKATAKRLGRGGSVQGSECLITKETAVLCGGHWLVPGQIHTPSKEDLAQQLKEDARDAAILRAREAGITDDDLKLIGGR